MANLMITTACNFNCNYCFGLEMIGPTHKKEMMEWDTFLSLVEWILRDPIPNSQIHLMGGEPTMHPRIGDMIDEIAKSKVQIQIFSNASVKDDPALLERSIKGGANWVINANDPSTYKGNQLEVLHHNLEGLGTAAMLTFNVTSANTPYGYIFDYIERYKLNKHIKIGVALPTMNQANVYAKKEDFAEIAAHIMKIHDIADDQGISIEFECGVPFCVFSPSQRKRMKINKISHCGSRLDITPKGDIIYCLPLANAIILPYQKFPDYRHANEWFQEAYRPYRSVGGSDECLTCEHIKNGDCMACLSYSLSQYNSLKFPEVEEAKSISCI